MRVALKQGGLAPGGLNFDAKVRRESSNDEDLFIAHVGAMDCFALALRRMATLQSDGILDKMVAARYASFDSDLGAKMEKGTTSFADIEKAMLAKSAAEQEPKPISGQQEKYEAIFNNYLHSA